MKKIPTLFERKYISNCVVETLPIVTKGMEWVLNGDGVATLKYDGSCCAIINGEFYKRYDAKNGKPVPKGAIKCQEKADPITGHFPCWVKVDESKPEDKWFIEAYKNAIVAGKIETTNSGFASGKISEHREFIYPKMQDGTYEAIGVHFQGNPYNLRFDTIVKHGTITINVERTFDGIKKYLSEHYIEGLVFWKDGIPQCKIKRSDFGFEWNSK